MQSVRRNVHWIKQYLCMYFIGLSFECWLKNPNTFKRVSDGMHVYVHAK